MTEPAIVVSRLGKIFHQYTADHPKKLKHLLTGRLLKIKNRNSFWCLRDVSFTVPKGQMTGIIGPNGSGKSTLLRLIGGVGKPDEGFVSAKGRIGALLDLGAGFHPDLSGRDNIYISGVVAGLTRQQISERFEEIVSFAELKSFLENPLRTYSSGMKMRLAFAVAVNIDPEILLIDEVLSVGDLSFQSKCLECIQQFKKKGCTILLVSHDMEQVKKLCDNVIWLRNGVVKKQGSPYEVLEAYTEEMLQETHRRTPSDPLEGIAGSDMPLKFKVNRFGSQEVEIVGVRLFSYDDIETNQINFGDPLRVEIDLKMNVPAEEMIFSANITTADGKICCEINSGNCCINLPGSLHQGTMLLEISRLDLIGGDYFVDVGVFKKDWEYAYDYHWHVYPMRITPVTPDKGFLKPPHVWRWKGRISG